MSAIDLSMRSIVAASLLFAAGGSIADEAASGAPAEGCQTFSWNMQHELALFMGEAASVNAGREVKTAPRILPGRLYLVALAPEQAVRFAHEPGKRRHEAANQGGLLRVAVPQDGNYRISLDQAVWVDVVHGAELITSNVFQGNHDCVLLHKSVEFTLPAHRDLVLQISGGSSARVKLSVTRAAV